MAEAVHNAATFHVRPGEVGDVPFLAATWAQSFWRESPWATRLRWAIFSQHHKPIIQRLLGKSSVLVACDPAHPEEILGYLVYEPRAVHFVYVKPPFRLAGVARTLLNYSGLPADLAGIAVTHPTKAWFTRPAFAEKDTGRVIREARPGIEEQFKQATHDPYLWMENP